MKVRDLLAKLATSDPEYEVDLESATIDCPVINYTRVDHDKKEFILGVS
jgi:hypothetical protein